MLLDLNAATSPMSNESGIPFSNLLTTFLCSVIKFAMILLITKINQIYLLLYLLVILKLNHLSQNVSEVNSFPFKYFLGCFFQQMVVFSYRKRLPCFVHGRIPQFKTCKSSMYWLPKCFLSFIKKIGSNWIASNFLCFILFVKTTSYRSLCLRRSSV